VEVTSPERPGDALDLLESHLVAAGAEGELALGMLNRLVREPDAWGQPVTILVGIEDDAPTSLVIRTGRHPALIVGLVEEDAIDFVGFVREMQRIGHVPTSVNGAVRCSVPFAAAWEQEAGVALTTMRETRAFELHQLRPPTVEVGRARVAVASDAGLLEPWCEGFARDIGEPLDTGDATTTVARFVAVQDMMLWETDDGPVSMAAIIRRTSSSSCLAWVYTPLEHRKHGYASAVVAALSQRELDAGASWCSLFTDLAHPTSNRIYTELGYEPRCDYRHIELVPR
jgi:GNAT superfamily N-acetyltransferase